MKKLIKKKTITILSTNKEGVDQLIKEHPPEIKNFNVEKLYYLISKVYVQSLFNSEQIGIKNGMPLSSKILKNIIGNNYRTYIDYLLYHNILGTNEQYIVGESSKKYELNPEFPSSPEFYTITDYVFKKKLKKHTAPSHPLKEYPALKKWLENLTINKTEAIKFLETEYNLKMEYPELRDKVTNGKSEKDEEDGEEKVVTKNPEAQKRHSLQIIELLDNKIYEFSVDPSGHRYHTILTICRKQLRNFITCNNDSLVSLDIKNSQPYILLALLNPNFWKKYKNSIFSYGIYFSKRSISIMIQLIEQIHAGTEFQRYRDWVNSGTFYDQFQNLLSKQNPLITRDIVKKNMMVCFYSGKGVKSDGVKTAFNTEFPKIYELLKTIKAKNYKNLALLLQRVESHLVLDKVCGRITKEKPSMPIFTIHDSIITTVGNDFYLKSIINEELGRFTGIPPSLETEYWSPDKAWDKLNSAANNIQLKVA